MRILSRQNLENIAMRVYSAYCKLPKAVNEPYRMAPKLLLTEVLKLKLDYRHLSSDRQTLGITTMQSVEIELPDSRDGGLYEFDGKTVLIEEDLQAPGAVPGRLNFTITHEACHHILYMLFPSDYGSITKERKVLHYRLSNHGKSAVDWEEWQTDTLASALLMPSDLLVQNAAICGIPHGIPILNRLWRPEEYTRFEALSNMMGVSKQALMIRMKHLGLIGKEYLRNPYQLLDISKEDDDCDV